LNAEGGNLFIGVDDMTHCALGTYMENKDYDEFKLKVVKTLKEAFSPVVADDLFGIRRIPVVFSANTPIDKKNHKHFVIKVVVKSDPEKIYYIKKYEDNEPVYTAYMRYDGLTKVLTGDDMNKLFLKKRAYQKA